MKTLLVILILATVFSVYAQQDVDPPAIIGFTFSPKTVNVTFQQQNLTISARIIDNRANDTGVASALVQLVSPMNEQIAYDLFLDNVTAGSDQFNGTWRAIASVPIGIDPGTWTVQGIKAIDNAGNSFFYNEPALAALGFNITTDLSLDVLSIPDTAAPYVSNITLTPVTVNLALSTPHLDFLIELQDPTTGTGVASAIITVTDANNNQYTVVNVNDQIRISGDRYDGMYLSTFYFNPAATATGVYTFGVVVRDIKGNVSNFDKIALQNNNLPYSFTVVNIAQTTGAPVTTHSGESGMTNAASSLSASSLWLFSSVLVLLALFLHY